MGCSSYKNDTATKQSLRSPVPEHFSTPLYIARDLGYFKDTGVNVELVLCPGTVIVYLLLYK